MLPPDDNIASVEHEPQLLLVATPIGNLSDMTLRAIEALRIADHIVAEDTRRTRGLLTHFDIDASKLSRLDANASESDLERVIRWVAEGACVAVVTDAGSPCVSDPGTALVRMAAARDLRVSVIPGASAVTAVVALSGLVDGPFCFLGFIPRSGTDRAQAITQIATSTIPTVLFEAPHRMQELADDLAAAIPNRQIVVGRELTKMHEQVIRATASDLASAQADWMGEIALVVAAADAASEQLPDDDAVDRRIDEEMSKGLHTKTVAERVAAWSGRPRREVYERVVMRKGK